MRTHTPFPILGMLLFLAILTAYLGGRSLRVSERSDRPYCFVYLIMVCLTMLVMFDLDHPRQGLIRLDYTDELFLDTRDALMNPRREKLRLIVTRNALAASPSWTAEGYGPGPYYPVMCAPAG